MDLDSIIRSVAEGNIEQILLYLPALIIGIGIIVLLIFYLKDNWKVIQEKLSKLKRKPGQAFVKEAKLRIGEQKPRIDYKKQVEGVLKEKNPTKATDALSVLINQYFSKLWDINCAVAYEELMGEMGKKGRVRLKNFFENLLRIEFSKDEVSRKDLLDVACEFLNLIKKYPLKEAKQPPKAFIQKIKILNRLRRFKKELQRDLEKKITFQEKLNKIIEKTSKSAWNFVKEYFSSTKTPKKVSLTTVLEDVKRSKPTKGLKAMFDEDQATVEGFLYFIYLTLRKRIREKKKKTQIEAIINKGRNLLKKKDAIQAKELYDSLLPLYNALSDETKGETLPKIALFYEDITHCINFQKAMMNLLHLKMALKAEKSEIAKQFYLKISEIYEQLPPGYKNEIYERFLDLEKELNIIENKGGK